jgi:amino acid transporter
VVAILILALMFNLESLAEMTNYILITVFIMINLALWRIKMRQDEAPSGVRTYPLAVPIIGTVLNLAVLVFQIVNALS